MATDEIQNRGPNEWKVSDDDQLSHKQRLRSLNRSRQEVLEVRREVAVSRLAGEVSRQDALVAYRETLEVLALDARPVLTADALDFEQDPWTEADLGTLVIAPPDEHRERARSNTARLKGAVPTPQETTFCGLGDLLAAPRPTISESWAYKIGTERYHERVNRAVPQSVLDTAYEVIDNALQQAEIGIKVSGKDQTRKLGVGEDGDEWAFENEDVRLPHETEGSR